MSVFLNLVYAALPLLFGLVLLKWVDDVGKTMLYSAFLGFVLYSIKNFSKVLVSNRRDVSGSVLWEALSHSSVQTVSKGILLLRNIVIDKVPIAVAVFVLFIMVKLVCSSCTLEYINRAADRFVRTRKEFLAVFFVLSLAFSIDDYLCCVGVCTVAAGIFARQGLTNEKAAYMTCLTAVALCTMLPYSTWMPVIRSAIGASVPSGNVILMNLAAVFFILIVMTETMSGKALSSTRKQFIKALPADSGKVLGVLILSAAATASALITVNLLTDGTWAVAAGGAAGCLVLATAGIPIGMVGMKDIESGLREAFKDTLFLFRTLFFVWLVKDICIELLGLNRFLIAVMEAAKFPYFLIPSIIFLASSCFSFITGTSFGAFSLFIPLAVSLLGNSGVFLKTVGASAALAGSLQSVNRPGSDVIRLVSGVLKCDGKEIRRLQKYWLVRETPVLFVSFLVMGVCARGGIEIMFAAGMLPVLLCTFLYYKQQMKKAYAGNEFFKELQTGRGIPYKVKYYTFYHKCKDLEALYAAILQGIRQKALALYPVNFI